MKKSRFTEEQIIGFLKEAAAGAKVEEVCRKAGIHPATYFAWKSMGWLARGMCWCPWSATTR